jgi:hypothetical protein
VLFARVEQAGRARAESGAVLAERCDHGRVTEWRDVERAEPEFAQRVQALFDAHRHKTIATLRADGSPGSRRPSRTARWFSAPCRTRARARICAGIRGSPCTPPRSIRSRVPRRSGPGEAKISGRAIAAGPVAEGPDGDRFRAEIAEVVHTHLNEQATMLVVEWWTPGHGLRRIDRD